MGPQTALATVDFSRQTVLVAEMGLVPTSGYTVKIASVTRTGSRVNVHVEQREPRNTFVSTLREMPMQVIVVSGRHLQPHFTITYVNHNCIREQADFGFCDVSTAPIAIGDRCRRTAVQVRLRTACFGPTSRARAEALFQQQIIDPTHIVSRLTGLHLRRVLVESYRVVLRPPGVTPATITYIPGTIVYAYGQLHRHVTSSAAFPVVKSHSPPTFVEVVEEVPVQGFLPDDTSLPWVQQDRNTFDDFPGRPTWVGPWRYQAADTKGITLQVSAYSTPQEVRKMGEELRASLH